MILISESCGRQRQRVILKLELWSTTRVCFIAAYVSGYFKKTKREYFALLLHVSPKCNNSQPMDYFDFLNV